MRLKFLISQIVLSTLFAASSAQSAIQAMASRVVYDGQYKAASLALKNNANKAYMVQTWLESGLAVDPQTKIPFVVTPPLMKIESQQESTLRFIYAGEGLAKDRESQFWINIQEIPPKPEKENTLQLAVRSKIKLFYRPQSIDVTLADAIKQVKWSVKDNALVLENNSPLFVTVGDLTLSGQSTPVKNLDQDMAAPFSQLTVIKALPKNVTSIQYTYLNEYGANVSMPVVHLK